MKKHHIALAITAITTVVGILGIVKGGTLPMHWKINGEVDRWGNSGELLIPMGIAIALYLLFWFCEKHPEYSSMNLRKEVKEKGEKMLSNFSAIINILLALLMLYVMLTITTILPLSPIMPIVILIAMMGIMMLYIQKLGHLNRNAVKGESADETTVSIIETETRHLASQELSYYNVWTIYFIPFIIIAMLLIGVVVYNSADLLPLISKDRYAEALSKGKSLLGIVETIGYIVTIVVILVNALIVTIVFRNSGRGEMFSAANVRKMNYIDYSFLALGIACLFIAPLTTGCAFYVIAVLALFIDYILKLFMHTFVKGYRMKEEQELTI